MREDGGSKRKRRNRRRPEFPEAGRQSHKAEQEDTGETRQEVKYLDRKAVEEIHFRVMHSTKDQAPVPERPHVLNPGMLELALELPRKRLYGRELYPDLFEKAAVLMRELIRGHVFEVANKRTAFVCAVVFLEENGYIVESIAEEAEGLTTRIATGQAEVHGIASWLKKHSRTIHSSET